VIFNNEAQLRNYYHELVHFSHPVINLFQVLFFLLRQYFEISMISAAENFLQGVIVKVYTVLVSYRLVLAVPYHPCYLFRCQLKG